MSLTLRRQAASKEDVRAAVSRAYCFPSLLNRAIFNHHLPLRGRTTRIQCKRSVPPILPPAMKIGNGDY